MKALHIVTPPQRWCLSKIIAASAMMVFLSGCAVLPNPFSDHELSEISKSDIHSIFKNVQPIKGELLLEEAIARALKYNLDHRARLMEEALSINQMDIDKFELLPEVVANAGYSARSNQNSSVSKTISTGSVGSDPSASAGKSNRTADLSLSWSILDFGIGYFTAKQNADRKLIASERRRRVIQNLLQEVRSAYWRAASAQILEEQVRTTIQKAEKALEESRQVEIEKLSDPLKSLRFQKTLLENLRQLEGIQQELATSYIELAALINSPPDTHFKLALPDTRELSIPQWSMNLEEMEAFAFVRNPDLREQIYEARIAANETRKTILGLVPGITFTTGRNYDGNNYLSNNVWNQFGAQAAFELINVFSGPAKIRHAEGAEAVAKARRFALRMAILAQVHVGYRQFKQASLQFQRADALYKVEKSINQHITAQTKASRQSVLESIISNTGATLAELRRFQTFAQAYAALGQMQATYGADLAIGDVQSTPLNVLTEQVGNLLKEYDTGAAHRKIAAGLNSDK